MPSTIELAPRCKRVLSAAAIGIDALPAGVAGGIPAVLTADGIRAVPGMIVVLVSTQVGPDVLHRGGGVVHGLALAHGGSRIAHPRLAPAVVVRVESVGLRVPILRGLAIPRSAGGFLTGHGLLAVGPAHAFLRLGLPAVGLRGMHLCLLPVLVRFVAPLFHLALAHPLGEHHKQHDAQQHGETDDDHDCDVHPDHNPSGRPR